MTIHAHGSATFEAACLGRVVDAADIALNKELPHGVAGPPERDVGQDHMKPLQDAQDIIHADTVLKSARQISVQRRAKTGTRRAQLCGSPRPPLFDSDAGTDNRISGARLG